MASHMFDAFYRMEYAPSRPLQLEACRAINSSTIPLLPQVRHGASFKRKARTTKTSSSPWRKGISAERSFVYTNLEINYLESPKFFSIKILLLKSDLVDKSCTRLKGCFKRTEIDFRYYRARISFRSSINISRERFCVLVIQFESITFNIPVVDFKSNLIG